MAWNPNVSTARTPARPNAQPSRTFKHSNTRTLFLVVIALVVLAALWFIFGRDRSPSGPQTPPAETPKKQMQMVDVDVHISTNKPPPAPTNSVPKPAKDDFSERRKFAEEFKTLTPEEQHEVRLELAREKPLDLTPTTNRPFRTGIELSMARIFMTPLGKPPPPLMTTFLPIADEARLMEILTAANPVIEGDTEIAKESKAMVQLAKSELLDYMKNGGSPEAFLQHYYGKLVEAYNERRDAMREVVRVAREEPDIANDFYKTVNEKLKAKGILPVELPAKAKAKFGLED